NKHKWMVICLLSNAFRDRNLQPLLQTLFTNPIVCEVKDLGHHSLNRTLLEEFNLEMPVQAPIGEDGRGARHDIDYRQESRSLETTAIPCEFAPPETKTVPRFRNKSRARIQRGPLLGSAEAS